VRKRSIIQMVLVGAAVGVALALVAVLIPWLPPADSTEAIKIDDVYWFVTIICIVIFAMVAGVALYAVWKFRAPPDDTEDGAPIHGHTGLEVVWTAVPAALVTAITIYSGIVLNQIDTVPKDHRVVEVTGQQFAWSFHYPDSDVTSGVLALPVGQTTELELTAKDVIHSFWVPEFRMKEDAVPGITTNVLVTPTKEGTYTLICTELCGLGHAVMRAQVFVLAQDDYEKWESDEKAKAAAAGSAAGKTLFTQQCGSCHRLADAGTEGEVGPDLDKVLVGKDADFIHESIVNPNDEIAPGYQPDVMPQTFGESLTDAQLQSLVEYLLKTAGKS
jgi:cytochrome c oxidase subunit II